MIKQIEKIFTQVTGITNINFNENTRIDKEFNITSLTLIQLVCAIEDEFDIEIPNSEIRKIKTVKDILVLLEKSI